MNTELCLRLNTHSEATWWIAEYAISEVFQQERYQKSWRRPEEKCAANKSVTSMLSASRLRLQRI